MAYSEPPDDYEPPFVHPGQTEIAQPNFRPGEVGPCFWCGEPAVHGGIDIGVRCAVDTCDRHFREIIVPAFAERSAKKESKRVARAQARPARRRTAR